MANPFLAKSGPLGFNKVYSDILAARRHQQRPAVPMGVNYRVLTVGPDGNSVSPLSPATGQRGFEVDFSSIADAMKAIPLHNPDANFTDRWLILVTPGVYFEEVRLKPFVTVMGLHRDSVFIIPPDDPNVRRTWSDHRRATVYLNHFSSIENVSIGKPATSESTDYAIMNRDCYDVEPRGESKRDPSDFAAVNVPIYPFVSPGGLDYRNKFPNEPPPVALPTGSPSYAGPRDEFVRGKSIRMEGDFSTAFMINVGSSYNYREGYDFEIVGAGKGVDTHIVNCFFDSLFIDRGDYFVPDGTRDAGCLYVENCNEVHVRSSLLRVGADRSDRRGPTDGPPARGAALRIAANAGVLLEGTTLWGNGSDRTLVVDGSVWFAHSSTDAIVRGTGSNVYPFGLPADPSPTGGGWGWPNHQFFGL